MSRVPPMRSRVRVMVRIESWLCVACFYCLCFDISRTVALGNKYTTISSSLPCFLCFGLFAPVCLQLHYRTPFRHFPPLCYFSLSSISSTEDQQDKKYQGFQLGNPLTMKTSATTSTTKCNPVKLCLALQTRNPFLDPLRLHKILQHESLTMCLTHSIAREQVKPL